MTKLREKFYTQRAHVVQRRRKPRTFTCALPPTPCTAEMRDKVRAAADADGIGVAEFMRRALSNASGKCRLLGTNRGMGKMSYSIREIETKWVVGEWSIGKPFGNWQPESSHATYAAAQRRADELNFPEGICAELVRLRAELDAFRNGQITEAMLRQTPDGAISVGNDCEIAVRGTTQCANELRHALCEVFIVHDGDVFYRTANGVPMDVPERIAKRIRAALDATQR